MPTMTLKKIFAVLPQYLLPQHLLSNWLSKLTHCENRVWKNLFIRVITRVYGVNIQEAKYQDIEHYASFNQFFTRELKDGARPIAAGADAIVSPADGRVVLIQDVVPDAEFGLGDAPRTRAKPAGQRACSASRRSETEPKAARAPSSELD